MGHPNDTRIGAKFAENQAGGSGGITAEDESAFSRMQMVSVVPDEKVL
jgi:hypothetical protein